MIHYVSGHKGKISNFAAVGAERCDKIIYHIAELPRNNESYTKYFQSVIIIKCLR